MRAQAESVDIIDFPSEIYTLIGGLVDFSENNLITFRNYITVQYFQLAHSGTILLSACAFGNYITFSFRIQELYYFQLAHSRTILLSACAFRNDITSACAFGNYSILLSACAFRNMLYVFFTVPQITKPVTA